MSLVDHEAGFVHLILQLPHELLKGFRCPLLDARLHHFDATLHAPQLFFAFELPMDVVRPAPDLFLLHVIVHVLVFFEVQVVAILDTFHRHAASHAFLCGAGEPRCSPQREAHHAHQGPDTSALLPSADRDTGAKRSLGGTPPSTTGSYRHRQQHCRTASGHTDTNTCCALHALLMAATAQRKRRTQLGVLSGSRQKEGRAQGPSCACQHCPTCAPSSHGSQGRVPRGGGHRLQAYA
mmetsp:Transcript_58892/g.167142  ORF Transcript_58892/g.167142 Transcript_58892/m.167142 type:complete len:237 (+) Transcript_58892:484-1194(+)